MSALFVMGLGVYLSGHGVRGVSNGGLVGSVMMIVGGILVLLTLVV